MAGEARPDRARWGDELEGAMNFAPAPSSYDQRDQAELRRALEKADAENYKRRQHVVLSKDQYIEMVSPDGTRYSLTVSNAGAVVVTAL